MVQYKKEALEDFKYFIGYQKREIVKPLCIILPQMSGYIKYFKNDGKNMSLFVRDNNAFDKYDEIWGVIKKKLKIKFHSDPVYDEKYLKTKVREFDVSIKKAFWVMVCRKKTRIILALLALLLILL